MGVSDAGEPSDAGSKKAKGKGAATSLLGKFSDLKGLVPRKGAKK
jgi:hypothetical protein